ncbi:hypothetical protein GCM10022419_121220 [Nonomuraea rosea]|uniref:Uncharacterized protein n=2 Tax=Nonomuraea rosea TaxID=638574 RepID=A0ABP6ZR60_9ACTN
MTHGALLMAHGGIGRRMSTLKVVEIRSDRVIGTLTRDGDQLKFSSEDVQELIETMAAARAWSLVAAFDLLRGWSNCYVEIVPEISVARVFDGVRDGVPYFLPDHPQVHDPRLADYLRAGAAILSTTSVDVDRLDPARGAVVPLSFRTDGAWIWTDTITYYLEEHGIRPDEELCAHIAAQSFRCPAVDQAVAEQTLRELRRSASN